VSSIPRARRASLAAGLAGLLFGCATAYQSGEVALREGRYPEAVARFSDALASQPAQIDARLGLGIAQYHVGSFEAARAVLDPAVLAAPDRAEGRLYLALTYLALGDRDRAAAQLDALRGKSVHPRLAAQAARAAALLRLDVLPTETDEFVRYSLEDEARWQQEVLEARLAPHMYIGPTWFVRDPAGWSPLGWYPSGVPTP
jgi:tetratricopeptide (TPR) repeat protein